jgi:hypothetical protein
VAQTRTAAGARHKAAAGLLLFGLVFGGAESEEEKEGVRNHIKKEMWPRTFEELVHCFSFLPVPGDRAPWDSALALR